MAYYFYEKRSIGQEFGLIKSGEERRQNFILSGGLNPEKYLADFYERIAINKETGAISFFDIIRSFGIGAYNNSYYQLRGPVYQIVSPFRFEMEGANYSEYSANVQGYAAGLVDKAGDFIDEFIAKEGDYPTDGVEGEYWYVQTRLASTVDILSPSGGEVLNKEYLITWEDSQKTNYDIELSYNNGQTWKRISTNVSGIDYEYNFVNEVETSTGRLRIRNVYPEGNGHWVTNNGVFTIQHDFPPSQPNRLEPFAGQTIDSTEPQTFSWKHNHPNRQSKFDLEWSTDQSAWNRISRSTTLEYQIISADTFPAGEIYWRVRTYSDAGLVSEWSNVAVFISALPSDAPEIVSGSQITGARPVFEWSQGDQASYEIELLNSINEVVWETGQVNSSIKAITSGVDLQDGQSYTFRIRTATDLGLWTEWAEQKLTVNYTPPPKPKFEINQADNYIYLNIINPQPEGLEPEVVYNDIYRDGERIATRVGRNYKDYTVRSDREYRYQVAAVGDNDTIRMSEGQSATLKLKSSYLGWLTGEMVQLEYNPQREESYEKSGELMFFAGRKKPVMQYEEHISQSLPLAFKILKDSTKEEFKRLVSSKELLIYRDNRGRKMFGTIQSFSIVDDTDHLGWYNVSFTFQELDYSEVV